MKNFRTYQLAKELYLNVAEIKLRGEVKDQMHRASLSVVLNLCEGSGKRTSADRRRFYSIAFGSLREVQALLELTRQPGDIVSQADSVAAHIYKLMQNPGSSS